MLVCTVAGPLPLLCFLCSDSERFLRRERQDLSPVDHARVVSDRNDRFPIWASHILLTRLLPIHFEGTCASPTHVLSSTSHPGCRGSSCRLVFHTLQVNLLHLLQFLRIYKTVTGATRPLTYLVLRLNVPLGILKELINVLSKHLLEVGVVDTTLLAALVVTRTSVFTGRVAAH